MTKELAIRVLTGDVLGVTEQTQEAVKIAVKALLETSGRDPVEREAVVDILQNAMQGCDESEEDLIGEIVCKVDLLPSAQPEPHEIGYSECANSTLKMWIDNVLTDGEYSHIMDKLNAYWAERRADGF